MRKIIIWLPLLVLAASQGFASASRTLDGQFITNGANTVTIPAATDTLVGKATTDTLTNKSISGSSNTLTNISLTTAVTGTLPVGNGGTGATSFTSKGILYGNTTSAIQVTAAGTQYQVLQAGSGGTPAFDAVHLDQSAAVTGALPVANGGTGLSTLTAHDVVVGAGTSPVALISPSTSGFVLTSNGTSADPSFQAPAAMNPALNGGSASPESVTAAGGITLSSIGYSNYVWVVGSPGAVTVTATPSITACTADGQKLVVVGTDNTKTVHLQDQANLASSGLSMNGDWVGAKDSAITFDCDITQGLWVEVSRR